MARAKSRASKSQLPSVQSRRAKRRLELVVSRKQNKLKRTSLLESIKKCQITPDQIEALHSTSSMQTKGLRKFKLDEVRIPLQSQSVTDLTFRRKRKRPQANVSSSSSSEDTDQFSTDTELYYESSESESPESQPHKETSQISKQEPQEPKRQPEELKQKNDQKNQTRQSLPAVYVPVSRDPEIQKLRLELPIIGEEQNIMENIRYNDIIIVSGETGSGKTTQIPQFLFEAGYALDGKMIGITEPRRVAAISMSQRVAQELNLSENEVSYQIRFAGNVTDKTQIKFMTDGVLLRECQQDFLLSKYSVIIIDEAHERSVFSDILIGLLSRIVPMRAKRNKPLKLIIMSATLRVTDFTENPFLFRKTPPVISIEARQFPVTVHFAKRTPSNYLQAAFRKVCSVHSKMPKGGILVFVTSQQDVKILCHKLREKFPNNKSNTRAMNDSRTMRIKKKKAKVEGTPLVNHQTDDNITMDNLKENIQFDSEEEEANETEDTFFSKKGFTDFSGSEEDSDDDESGIVAITKAPLHCLTLYAMLPMAKQQLVFRDPPEGTRLCVVATNVAETSITIPNIKYVVDTGMEKVKVYNLVTGVSKFVTTWTSKSSSEQRMGRAGRVGPGFCYRLYSSAVYTNDLPNHAEPRILQKPVDDVLLQMKSMNIDNVVNFPFPTRPSTEALMAAEKKLILLGALDDSKNKNAPPKDKTKTEFSSRPTALGRAMSRFAVSARCSKMIVLSPGDLLSHVVCLVSAMTVREMFIDGKKWQKLRKKWAGHGSSKLLGDFMPMIRATCLADSFGCANKQCLENGLRTKAMLEIDRLRKQLTKEINQNLNYPILETDKTLKKTSEAQTKILRQLLLASFCDHVARKLPDTQVVKKDPNDPNKIEKLKIKNAYECMEVEGPVYISSESVIKGDHPDFLIYKELYNGDKKIYMRDVAVIQPDWLPYYASKLCHFSEIPEQGDVPKYDEAADQIVCDRSATFGPLNWQLGAVEVPMDLVDSGVDIYKHFAKHLLLGRVFKWFCSYADKLLSPPNIMTKPWSKLLPRTNKLLICLVNSSIKTRKDLIKMWTKDETFLKQEFLLWVPENLHDKVNQHWKLHMLTQ